MTCQWPDKQAHANKAAAKAAIAALYRAGKGNPDLAPYPCPGSKPQHWHIGHDVRAFAHRIRTALKPGRDPDTTYARNHRRKR